MLTKATTLGITSLKTSFGVTKYSSFQYKQSLVSELGKIQQILAVSHPNFCQDFCHILQKIKPKTVI